MKKFLAKLNELQKMELLAAIVSVVLMLLALIPLLLVNQPGWLIGAAIGSAIELVNILLLYKGSEIAMKTFKTWLFLLLYFARMFLFLIGLVLVALLQFGFGTYVTAVPAFKYAIWGVLIGYTPLQIVIVVVMVKSKKNFVTISENNQKEEEK